MKPGTMLARAMLAFLLLASLALRVQAAGVPPNAHPAFWVLEEGSHRVFLLGSVHLLPPDMIWMRGEIEDARTKAQVFVFEAPLRDSEKAMASFVERHGKLPAGQTLQGMMPVADFEALEQASLAVQYPPKLLLPFRPWLAAVYLELYSYLKAGYSPYYGVDRVIEHDAELRHAPFAYLESVDEQLSYFLKQTPEAEMSYLRSTVHDVLDSPELPGQLIDAWAQGDTKRLGELIDAGMASTPQLKAQLLISRNRKWVPQIVGMLRSGKTHFITVGAGHLIGRDSIVAMLRAKGFKVTGP